jgi:poly(3-hydroxybutyrate) depolymerase
MTIAPDTPTLVHDSYEGATGSYYVTTPPSYDVTGTTPMRLLVWMHGCGGEAEGDSFEMIASNELNAHGETQDDETRDFIVISIGGTDGGCWNPDTDVVKVLMAIADVTTHFNIDRRHIFIAGYSSGGDLAYRTIFYNADEFAGILAVNTNPFRDTGSTEAQSMAAAAWTFNIAQVAHTQDTEYHPNACTDCLEGGGDDPGVTPAMNDLSSAGYNVQYMIKPGTHSDEDDFVKHTGTDYDFRQYVLPFIDNPAWESPGS